MRQLWIGSCVLAGLLRGSLLFAQTSEIPSSGAFAAKPNSEATAAFDAALKAVAALPAYHVRLAMVSKTPGLETKAEGQLVLAPGRKVRYEMKTRRGIIEGQLRIVSDGKQIWRLEQYSPKAEWITYPLATMDAELENLGQGSSDLDLDKRQELKKDLEIEHGFRGILPSLEDAKSKLIFNAIENGTLERAGEPARPVLILRGEWSKEVRAAFIPPKQEPPPPPEGKPPPKNPPPPPPDPTEMYEKNQAFAFQPRFARLFLDPSTKMPLRLQWFGPERNGGENVLLSQTDWFGLAPQPEERLAGHFSLSAEEAKMPSRSFDFKEAIRRRVDLLVRQRQQERERQQMQQRMGRP